MATCSQVTQTIFFLQIKVMVYSVQNIGIVYEIQRNNAFSRFYTIYNAIYFIQSIYLLDCFF